MKLNEYIVEIQMKYNFISLKVKEESAELALNKVQGMFNAKEGWIHLEDSFGTKYRVKNDQISFLRVNSIEVPK